MRTSNRTKSIGKRNLSQPKVAHRSTIESVYHIRKRICTQNERVCAVRATHSDTVPGAGFCCVSLSGRVCRCLALRASPLAPTKSAPLRPKHLYSKLPRMHQGFDCGPPAHHWACLGLGCGIKALGCVHHLASCIKKGGAKSPAKARQGFAALLMRAVLAHSPRT